MITYIHDGFWTLDHDYLFIRDHPEWQKKHPQGSVTFDVWCSRCKCVIASDTTNTIQLAHRQFHIDMLAQHPVPVI